MTALVDEFVLAGTGSRSLRMAPREVQVDAMRRCEARIRERRAEHGDKLIVMSGMAEGWDELIARTAIRLGVDLWCVIPNRGYGQHYWGRNSLTGRDRFAEFCEFRDQAWRVTHVMEDIHHTSTLYLDGEHSNFVRNRFMADGHEGFSGADDFVVWNPESKGTAHCVAAIKRSGKWRDDMVLSPPELRIQVPAGIFQAPLI